MELRSRAIKGIGDTRLYSNDRYKKGESIYGINFEFFDGVDRRPEGCGLNVIDHLTHNVQRGHMNKCASFYHELSSFQQIRYFYISGE